MFSLKSPLALALVATALFACHQGEEETMLEQLRRISPVVVLDATQIGYHESSSSIFDPSTNVLWSYGVNAPRADVLAALEKEFERQGWVHQPLSGGTPVVYRWNKGEWAVGVEILEGSALPTGAAGAAYETAYDERFGLRSTGK